MSDHIYAREDENGPFFVVGTHRTDEAISALIEHLKICAPESFSPTDFSHPTYHPLWARPDWATWEDSEQLTVPFDTKGAIPMLVIYNSPEVPNE